MDNFEKLIFEKLIADVDFDLHSQAKDYKNFEMVLDRVFENQDVTSLTNGNKGMSRKVTGDIMDFVGKVKKEVQDTHPFAPEEQLLKEFSESHRSEFKKIWEPVSDFLKETYSKDIDTSFYSGEFDKSLADKGNRKEQQQNELRFESTKSNLINNWTQLLSERKDDFELEIIARLGAIFLGDLFGTAIKAKKLKGILGEDDGGKKGDGGTGDGGKTNTGAGGKQETQNEATGNAGVKPGGTGGKKKEKGGGDGEGEKLIGEAEGGTGDGGGDKEGNGSGGGGSDDSAMLWDMAKGEWKSGSVEAMLKFAEELRKDPSIQNLAEILGRSLRDVEYETETYISTEQKPEYKIDYAGKSDLVGVQESDDLNNMLAMEKVLLSDPELQPLFFKKFVEKKLETYEYRSLFLSYKDVEVSKTRLKQKEVQSGPFILCCDTSWSMSASRSEMFSKAICFAILKIAIRDNRDVYFISFSDKNLITFNFTGSSAIEDVVKFLSMTYDGGTDVGPSLITALNGLETDNYKRADVLLCSDFEMKDISDEIKERMELSRDNNKTKFYGLLVKGCGDYEPNYEVLNFMDGSWLFDGEVGNSIKMLKKNN